MLRRQLLLAVAAALLLAAPAAAATHGGAVSVHSAVEGDFDLREDFTYTVRWLVYDAAAGHDNKLRVRFDGRDTILTDPTGVKARSGCRQRSRTRVVCTLRGRRSAAHPAAVFSLRDGDDELRMRGVSRDASTAVRAGAGDDLVRGSAGADEIRGDAGDDTLAGRDGDDSFGRLAERDGADRMSGGGGFDQVSYAIRNDGVHADLEGDADDGEAGEGDRIGADVEWLTGGWGPDELVGDGHDNRLGGGAGADRLRAGAGDDWLGSRGDGSLLDGGPGEDALLVLGEAATVDGGPGRDGIDDGSGETGDPSTIAAQDGAPDEIVCDGTGDAVTADAGDLVAGCTAITRTGAPAGRLLLALTPWGALMDAAFSRRFDWVRSERTLSLYLGCPQDMGRACRLRVELLRGTRRLLRTGIVEIEAGGLVEEEAFLSRPAFRRAKGRRLTARVTTIDRDGAAVVQRERVRVRVYPFAY